MTLITGISHLDRRISVIESRLSTRLGKPAGTSVSTEISGPTDPTVGFDPFGSAYQQAIAAGDAAAGQYAAPDGGADNGLTPTMRVDSFGGSAIGSMAVRSVSGGATVGQVGGYGAMPVPAELAAYGNGAIPSAALEPIGQDGHWLYRPAAQAWQGAVAAARADGVELRVTDSYRSYDQQVALAEDKGLYADGGLAAVPGTSNHGWGLALDVDVDNSAALKWLQANGHSFGFVEAVRREPWHWEYRPSQA